MLEGVSLIAFTNHDGSSLCTGRIYINLVERKLSKWEVIV